MHSPRWLLEEGPYASAHHAAAIQALHPPVSRRSRLTATPPDLTAQPSSRPGGSILNRHLVSCQPRWPQSALMQQPARQGEAAGF
jgi:hypothetical protein